MTPIAKLVVQRQCSRSTSATHTVVPGQTTPSAASQDTLGSFQKRESWPHIRSASTDPVFKHAQRLVGRVGSTLLCSYMDGAGIENDQVLRVDMRVPVHSRTWELTPSIQIFNVRSYFNLCNESLCYSPKRGSRSDEANSWHTDQQLKRSYHASNRLSFVGSMPVQRPRPRMQLTV